MGYTRPHEFANLRRKFDAFQFTKLFMEHKPVATLIIQGLVEVPAL